MKKSVYIRGLVAQGWYNFTEGLVQCLLLKPINKNLIYNKHIKYGNGKLQYINFFSRKDLSHKKKPLLIYIHGGSWVSGITEMRNSYIAEWAKMGFVTAAVSYSYAPQKIFPYQLQEMFNAIDYILDNADEYEIDINNIVLAGESAGGYFISYACSVIKNRYFLTENNLTFRNVDLFKVKGLVSISGCYDLRRLCDKSKPQSGFPDLKTMIKSYLGMPYDEAVEYLFSDRGANVSPVVNEAYPPSFIIWADKDLLRYESFDFADQLNDCNVPNSLYKADGIIGMHAWPIVTLFRKTYSCLDATFDFILPLLDDYFEKEDTWFYKTDK